MDALVGSSTVRGRYPSRSARQSWPWWAVTRQAACPASRRWPTSSHIAGWLARMKERDDRGYWPIRQSW